MKVEPKMSPRKLAWIIATMLILTSLCIWAVWVRPELKFHSIVKRYPVGTSAQKVLADYDDKVFLQRNNNILEAGATEEERKKSAAYYISIPGANAYLYFNYEKELMGILRLSDSKKPQR